MITAPPEATVLKVSGTTGQMCTEDMVKRCLRKQIRSYPFKVRLGCFSEYIFIIILNMMYISVHMCACVCLFLSCR